MVACFATVRVPLDAGALAHPPHQLRLPPEANLLGPGTFILGGGSTTTNGGPWIEDLTL